MNVCIRSLPCWFVILPLFCCSLSAAEDPLEVKTVLPARGLITRAITLPAEVKPYQSATLYAKIGGYLKLINVDKGDEVKQGALVAEIEVPELLADLGKSKAEVELAELDYRRLAEAQKKAPDLVVPLAVDTAKSKTAVAKANLERAETLLQFTRITAPFSGIVTRRMVDPGAFIPAATSGSTPQNSAIITLMDFNRVRVQVAVPEVESSRVAKDQPVSVTVEGLPHPVDGRITRFSYALDETTRTMLAEIDLLNRDLLLRPGMYATVRIGIQRKEDALLVPLEALIIEKSNAFVFTVEANKAKKIPVKVGFIEGSRAEILEGLAANQPVILPGKRTLTDTQPVRPLNAK